MMRGVRRGCVRLKGAVIGIDDEDDSTFTITVDQKTFHFQARDADEKERWIDALENTILRHSQPVKRWQRQRMPSSNEFDKKLSETDAYLQILIEQIKELEERIAKCDNDESRAKYAVIKESGEKMIESVKQSIVLLQITKHSLHERFHYPEDNVVHIKHLPVCASERQKNDSMPSDTVSLDVSSSQACETGTSSASNLFMRSAECIQNHRSLADSATFNQDSGGASTISVSLPNLNSPLNKHDTSDGRHSRPKDCVATSSVSKKRSRSHESPSLPHHVTGEDDLNMRSAPSDVIPEASYSTSEDEDFFDAEDTTNFPVTDGGEVQPSTPQVIASQDDYFDELYDNNTEEDLGTLESHGNLITHLLSQVRIGMDLTKVVLPTFILEKRSLLEMFADFFAHPDIFVGIVDQKTPKDRMIQTVRWYLSAFHAGRRSQVAKKPYNPILGEIFKCYYDIPDISTGKQKPEDKLTNGPIPWATKNNLIFIAEQVSHHPPISAFYAECFNKRISMDGYIWTKSKFLGLSIGVHMIGQALISVPEYDEDYIITFPNAYGRSILTVPWMEMGGKVSVTCQKTGYYANIEFLTKPFYGGKKDQICAEIFAPNEKKSFCIIKGEWNGVMWAKYSTGMNEIFVDTKTTPVIKKKVPPIDQQEEFESRRLWKEVTYNLKAKNIEIATQYKHQLEQQQRDEARERKEHGLKWETKFFHEEGEHWLYDDPLVKRLSKDSL
ncbi:hypothetical protein LSH36_68g05061 [Paralvinella palmiformis]|uniref:Oxysterol-binding protein n=1 Tax=Paralvinella palmiformis TaxID=53620 RepID=A0AAD9K4C4_9ANNE|nr:hypothetical protein LSH36_68g05061 [Paralvinella palmiformis]